MEYDAKTKLFLAEAVVATQFSSNIAVVGAIIDTKLFESLTLGLNLSNFTDGVYTMTIEHGDDPALSDTAPVTIADDPKTLIPAIAANLLASAAGFSRLGYIGKKRFVRVTLTSTGVSTGADAYVVAIQANAQSGPTADQIAA